MAINFSRIKTLFLSSLLLCKSKFQKEKKFQYFWFEISLLQDSKQKETYLRWVKYFKNLKGMVIDTVSTSRRAAQHKSYTSHNELCV